MERRRSERRLTHPSLHCLVPNGRYDIDRSVANGHKWPPSSHRTAYGVPEIRFEGIVSSQTSPSITSKDIGRSLRSGTITSADRNRPALNSWDPAMRACHQWLIDRVCVQQDRQRDTYRVSQEIKLEINYSTNQMAAGNFGLTGCYLDQTRIFLMIFFKKFMSFQF